MRAVQKVCKRLVGRARGVCKKMMRPLRGARRRWASSVRAERVASALDELIGERKDCLMMHSSLSGCGHIVGGEDTIVKALRGCCTTACVPTHTYCYPRGPGEEAAIFDPRKTPSVVGQITNYFFRLPGAVRSIHPSHSLAAIGPRAAMLCEAHERCDTPCGPGTPYTKLIALDAGVLMFGATMNTYTFFHTAEDAAGCPYLYYAEPVVLRALDYEGRLHTFRMRRQDMSIDRRFEAMDTILEAEGLLRRAVLGRGELLYLPSSRQVHEFLVDQLAKDPYYLLSDTGRKRVMG